MDVELKFPDGTKKQIEKGSALQKVSGKDDIVAKLNGKLVDLAVEINDNSDVEFFTARTPVGLEVMRHSCAHVLANAVQNLFPDAKPTIGPVVQEGFYYDFDFRAFTPEDIKNLEKEMNRIIAKNDKFERVELSMDEAKKTFANNKYKLELIDEFGSGLSAYRSGNFIDLCRGPHVPSTGCIKSFKLTKIAGAYWRADARNPQLQRIYGIAFVGQDELKEHLRILEEAEKRDHRKLGKRLGLFSLHDEGPGFIFWLPKGVVVKSELINFWKKKHKDAGYMLIETPMILNRSLWEQSGHWTNYRQNMYTLKIDDMDYAIKPMNCPGGMLVYKETSHSYKELPLRVGELGFVHRHELSGVLAGLFRVRAFTQDDAHIYMAPEQVEQEVINVINLCNDIYTMFGFSYHVELSTMPEKHTGTPEQWEQSTNALKNSLDKIKMEYKINPGDGAFYGPKIDFHLKDAIGRTWQCGTIQVDMSNPDKFDLTYEGADGKKHRPVMIHRTLFGSIERFLGILIEHFAGKFPMWLSPEQVRVITVADRFNPYAEEVVRRFDKAGIRVTSDFRTESVPKKIREAQLDYVNYMIVIGEQEVETKTINVRTRDNQLIGAVQEEDFLKKLHEEIADRK
jgi:threonyl-tRNA synthetase